MLYLKKKNKGFTLIEVVVVITILGVLLTLSVPRVKQHMDSAKKLQIQSQCREIVIAVETYNSEVKEMDQICSDCSHYFIVCNESSMIMEEKTKHTLQNILMRIEIQHLLGDTTNKIEVANKEKKPSKKLENKFEKIPPKATYEQIKRVAEGAMFEINQKGMLFKVEKEDGEGMELVSM